MRTVGNRTIIVGDFNYPGIDWNKRITNEPMGRRFLDACEDNFPTQHVNFPTRGENVLDLLVSSDPDLVKNVQSSGKLSNSDHLILKFDVVSSPTLRNPSVQRVPDFFKADFDAICRELNDRSWETDFACMNACQRWDHFHNIVQSLVK